MKGITVNERKKVDRRHFISIAGAAATGIALPKTAESAESSGTFKPLGPSDKVAVKGDPVKIAEEVGRLGAKYYGSRGGCARCTVTALQDTLDFVPKDASLHRAGACLDSGSTTTGLANCGAFTGGGMMFGFMAGGDDFGDTRIAHSLIRKLHKKYDDRYKSVLCRDVRKVNNGKCTITVGLASKWITEILLEQFGEDA